MPADAIAIRDFRHGCPPAQRTAIGIYTRGSGAGNRLL